MNRRRTFWLLRVRLRMSWMSDPAEEQISHSEEDHGFGDVEALLVIADQPALCISSRLAFPTSSAGLLDAAITLQPKETGHLDHPGSSHRWSSTPTLCAPSCLRARWRRASSPCVPAIARATAGGRRCARRAGSPPWHQRPASGADTDCLPW